MNLADSLSGKAGLEGIRWVLLSGTPHKALRRELGAMLSSPERLGPCHLRRVRFKPGRKIIGYYDAHIRHEGGYQPRPIAVTWGTHRDGDRCHAKAEVAELEIEAARRGLSAPFRKLAVDTPDLRMHIRISPVDARFPQLVRACDPQYVREMVAEAAGHVPANQYSATFIRYRPGQRHVLRYDAVDAPEYGSIFAKLYTSQEGAKACHLARQIGEWLRQRSGVTSVSPLGYAAGDAAVLYPMVRGTALSEFLQRSGESLANALRGAGAVLYALHQMPPAVAGSVENHDFAAEVDEIARTSEHIPALLPAAGASLAELLDRARQLHGRLPIEPPAFVHCDFKADHVWLTDDGAALIDFDDCSIGDPALDIGKFLGDLRFWCAAHGRHQIKRAQGQFLAGYGPGATPERLMRARLYESIELVKQAVRHVRVFEPEWARRTTWWIDLAHVLLNELERSLGLPAVRSASTGLFPTPMHAANGNQRVEKARTTLQHEPR